jgi:UPF0716 family protein affecting phage T7 exclusion
MEATFARLVSTTLAVVSIASLPGLVSRTCTFLAVLVFIPKGRRAMSKKSRRKARKAKKHRISKGYSQRAGWCNRHHMRNKCRGGDASPSNILIMDERRHAAWHLLFKNMDFKQVIKLLERVIRMKEALKGGVLCTSDYSIGN